MTVMPLLELFDVLSGTGHTVVVVQVRESTEHAYCCLTTEGNDESLLLRTLNVKYLNHGAIPGDCQVDDLLVDLFCILVALAMNIRSAITSSRVSVGPAFGSTNMQW